MQTGKVLVVGGYGNVGSMICTSLAGLYPQHVIAAGRNQQKAQRLSQSSGGNILPLEVDIFDPDINFDEILEGVSLVIMCLDQSDTRFVEQILQRGIDYIDITANTPFILAAQGLDALAKEKGGRAVLSVGLAPGLTNLLARHASEMVPDLQHLDIFVMLGLGEAHGEAAIRWTLENINAEYSVLDQGIEKQVRSFEEGKGTVFPEFGNRTAYRYNFPDQITVTRTLGLDSVSTWLCFDSPLMTVSYASLKKLGLFGLLQYPSAFDFTVDFLKRFQFGTEAYVVQASATSAQNGQTQITRFTITGDNEARMTAKVTTFVAASLLASPGVSGVFHIEQLIELQEIIEGVGDVEFTSESEDRYQDKS